MVKLGLWQICPKAATGEYPLLVDGGCCYPRNRRHIADGQAKRRLTGLEQAFRGNLCQKRCTPVIHASLNSATGANRSFAVFGVLVPADFWAFDSMRRGPMPQTLLQ